MIGSPSMSLLRIESTRAARNPRRGLRLALSIAVPVAAAVTIGLCREVATHDSEDVVVGLPFERFVVTAVLGFVLLQIGLVAAAGSLVSSARRRREFAVYATNGASRASLVLAGGWVASCWGAIGAASGVAVGIAVATVLAAIDLAPRVAFESLATSAPFLGGCVAIAIAISGVAGAVPAWIVARTRPRDALLRGGSRGESRGAERVSIGIVGVAITLSIVVSILESTRNGYAILAILASLVWLATIPAQLAAFSRVAAHLPLSWRIAGRDAVRMRERFAPGVAAAAVSVAAAIALATLFAAVESHARSSGGLGAVDADHTTLTVILALCAGSAITTTLFSSSLAASESEADARTLSFLGADPKLVRRCAAASAGVLAISASSCAIPAGLFAAIAGLSIANSPLPLRIPWPVILALAGVVSIVTYAARRFGPAPRPPPAR